MFCSWFALGKSRSVTQDEGVQKAKEHQALFMEVSAKSGAFVHDLFKTIASILPGVETSTIIKDPTPGSKQKTIRFDLGAVPESKGVNLELQRAVGEKKTEHQNTRKCC